MSSELLSTLQTLRGYNYGAVVQLAIISHDYFLTFTREVDYIWCKPWTLITTLFVLVRYVGIGWTFLDALGGTTFLSGPIQGFEHLKGMGTYLAAFWTYPIFYTAADLVMILRVYAMWSRSKMILYSLLFVYVVQGIFLFVATSIDYDPNAHLSVTTVQILNFTVCSAAVDSFVYKYAIYPLVPQMLLSTMLFGLAITQTVKQSMAVHKLSKKWQPNKYMQQLVKDGIVYFLIIMFHTIENVIRASPTMRAASSSLYIYVNCMTTCVLWCITMPRFIIGIRELYERDCHDSMDSGFGMSSQNVGSRTTVLSTIAFEGHLDEGVDTSTVDGSEESEWKVLEGNTDEV